MRTSEFTMSVRVIAFYHGKEISDLFEKKKRSNLTSNCPIPKFRFVIKIKVYI